MDHQNSGSDAMSDMHHDHAAMGHDMANDTEMTMTAFTTDVSGLPDAVETEIVVLDDGDSFDITASYVKRQVGNRSLRMLAYNNSVP
ncbi:MAG: hypothetical protein GTO60_04790, partial [Gammaproteobacteria bacterium]|nr:hypothetical protein [Gammaproteobacteria bacterium]